MFCVVQVLMLVWDDQTNNYGLHSGLMSTHDQDTLNYFKGTAVTCLLCPRQGSEEDSYLHVSTVQYSTEYTQYSTVQHSMVRYGAVQYSTVTADSLHGYSRQCMCADMHLPHTTHVLALQMQEDATL